MSEITIIASREDVVSAPGDATVITAASILQYDQSDIQGIIRQLPGVSVQLVGAL